MRNNAIYFVIVLSLCTGTAFAGENELKAKIKNLQDAEKKGQRVVVNDVLRGELRDFLNKNQDVPVKNFKKFRLAVKASGLIIRDLNNKYGAKEDNYQESVTDKNDKYVYRVALRILEKDYYKEFYICKGSDEKKVKESWAKVDKLRDQISAILKKDASLRSSDEVIKLEEQILEECRFEGAEFSLLAAYRTRGDKDEKYRTKFNELMLRMIADDQVNYDYLYEGLDSFSNTFFSDYLYFLHYVNSHHKKLILTKDQVKFIAENVLDKHRELFNMRRYYPDETGFYDEYGVRDVIQSMVNLSNWLRHYKLDDLNEKIIKRFFNDEFVISAMRQVPWFKDYLEYLMQREDFQKYKEE